MAASIAPPQAFDYTATGTLGDKRDTMLENELLLRCQLSQPMRRGYTQYPGNSYRYGKPNAVKDGGAAEALSGWPTSGGMYFHNKKDGSASVRPDRDFMALNRSAVQAGLTSAREQKQFRATHDMQRKVQTEGNEKKTSRRIPPTMVYGIATRPSTPIHDLLEHKYQDRWVAERRTVELSRRKKDNCNKLTPGKVYETRASMLRSHQVPVQSAPLWQLPKFTNKAEPQLETFRSSAERERSLAHHSSDALGRRGVFGHGIHEPSKN